MPERIAHAGLRGKVMTADEAAAFINPGDMIRILRLHRRRLPRLPGALAKRITGRRTARSSA